MPVSLVDFGEDVLRLISDVLWLDFAQDIASCLLHNLTFVKSVRIQSYFDWDVGFINKVPSVAKGANCGCRDRIGEDNIYPGSSFFPVSPCWDRPCGRYSQGS